MSGAAAALSAALAALTLAASPDAPAVAAAPSGPPPLAAAQDVEWLAAVAHEAARQVNRGSAGEDEALERLALLRDEASLYRQGLTAGEGEAGRLRTAYCRARDRTHLLLPERALTRALHDLDRAFDVLLIATGLPACDTPLPDPPDVAAGPVTPGDGRSESPAGRRRGRSDDY